MMYVELLRMGGGEEDLSNAIASIWNARTDRYSEQRSEQTIQRKVEMSYIGG